MATKRFLNLSVHDLVDFLLRVGDIDSRVYNQETMLLGSKIHASFQKKQGRDYLSEVPLEETFVRKEGTIHLEGRADGIIVGGDFPVIDEIKSTVLPLEEFYHEQKEWHLGQASCYALMYLHQEKLEKCGIRLTYISQIDNTQKVVEDVYSLADLEEKIGSLMDQYLAFYEKEFSHLDARNLSCKNLPFPFSRFRDGQREMAKYAYSVALQGGTVFFEAPTGIGKTMSVLYPSLKAFAKGENRRIFYLTAKSSGREAASEALARLYEKGLVARDSLLTAKEKICFSLGKACNPDECPFAKDYYTKLPKVLEEALASKKRFSFENVVSWAKHHAVCPFELQLDLSLWADVIICDYNYLFDPLVHLERFFGDDADPSHDLALVDEAHNLVDRGRDMYSASLSADECAFVKKKLAHFRLPAIKKALSKLEKTLREYDLANGNNVMDLPEIPKEIARPLEALSKATLSLNKEPHPSLPDSYKNLSREAHRFAYLDENYPTETMLYGQREGSDYVLHLYCPDPSDMLKASLSPLKGRIIFSATLSPISYYMDAIMKSHDWPYLLLPSPFPKENFLLLLAPMVSTRYKDRAKSYGEVADYLQRFVSGKKGNYFLYFPSYDYLEAIAPLLHFSNADVYTQERDMDDEEKEIFLSRFLSNPAKTTIGLLIIGGSFSEGVDLVADRLIGVAVVGIGLPQMCHERDILRDYYDKQNGQGFDYAYRNPGMNKVMQAVGRLIRSESDIGAALLIDDRYLLNSYRDLFARSWKGYDVVTSPDDVEASLSSFYKKKDK